MAAVTLECGDFLEFQSALQKMRQVDDKIIYMLNAIIPTESFRSQVDPTARCKELYEQILSEHKTRELAIVRCLNSSKEKIRHLKVQKDNGDESPKLHKNLIREQGIQRLLQSELEVEEVVKKRTANVYYERCRDYFKPPRNVEV